MRRSGPALVLALFAGCATAGDLAGDGADDGRRSDVRDAAADDGAAVTDGGDGAPDSDAVSDTGPDTVTDSDVDADADARDDGTVDDGVADADVEVRDDGTADTTDGGALDPELSLPDPGGAPCATPSSMGECPGIEVCRFYDSVEGRCESCSPCGNLGDICSASSECDILFMCYRGRCTNFCLLETYMCGAIADCIDVGHPSWGVCRP